MSDLFQSLLSLRIQPLIDSGRYDCLALNFHGTFEKTPDGKIGPLAPADQKILWEHMKRAHEYGLKLALMGHEAESLTQHPCTLPCLRLAFAQEPNAMLSPLFAASACPPERILYLSTQHGLDRHAAWHAKVTTVFISKAEQDYLNAELEKLGPEKANLLSRCEATLDVFAQTGHFNVSDIQSLFMLPDVRARIFVYRFFYQRLRDASEQERAEGLLKKLWYLGARDFSLASDLWQTYCEEPSCAASWAFLREALRAAEKLDSVDYALNVHAWMHGHNHRAYNAGLPRSGFQDADLISAMQRFLKPLPLPQIARCNDKKRICYVLASEAGENYSPICDATLALAENADQEKFEIAVASMLSEAEVMGSTRVGDRLRALRTQGCDLFFFPNERSEQSFSQRLAQFATELAQQGFDALVFTSLCNQPQLLAMLRPARLMVGLGFGDVDVYTSPLLDFTAHWLNYPVMDSLCTSYRLPDSMPADRYRVPDKKMSPSDLGVPDTAFLIMSSGRPVKYQSDSYWRVVAAILRARQQTHFAFVGPVLQQIQPWVDKYIATEDRHRLHCLGWRQDHLEVLTAARLILDTIPAGGGFNLTEAMNLGLPTLLCRNSVDDYFNPYENEKLLPIGEILDDPELSFEWSDEDGMIRAALSLIDQGGGDEAMVQRQRAVASKRKDVRATAARLEELIMMHLQAK